MTQPSALTAMSKFGTGSGEGVAMKVRYSMPGRGPSGLPLQREGQTALDSKWPKTAHVSTWF